MELMRDTLRRIEESGVAPDQFPRVGYEPLIRALVNGEKPGPEHDRCPLLSSLRDSPRDGRVRAVVAARVAEVFS